MTTIKYTAAAIILLMLAAPAVFGHHLWIEKTTRDQWAVMRGIVPDRIDPYDPDCIQAIAAFGANGEPLAIERKNKDTRAIFKTDGEVAMATAYSEWGYRVNTTRGKRLITRAEAEDEGLQVLSAFFSTHYAKSLFAPSEAASKPTDLRFEIIPMEDPVNAAPGSEIAFTVLFDGEPLEGASIHTATNGEVVTDADGTGVVEVPDQKRALLYARHRIDVDGDDKKDYNIFTTFLTFEVNQ